MKKIFTIVFAILAASAFHSCTQTPASCSSVEGQEIHFFHLGQSRMHPNSVVVAVADTCKGFKYEWYEDGSYMGVLRKVEDDIVCDTLGSGAHSHVFYAATPSQYSNKLVIVVSDMSGKAVKQVFDMSAYCDVQAHRGGAGLKPEDTIESQIHALELGCNTLELDVWLSKDKLPVVSHDSYFHPRYSTRPDGTRVLKNEPKEYLYTMPYDSIAKYDVGLAKSEKFPDHELIPAKKPLLSELIDACEKYAKDKGLDLPRYNIEIKNRRGKGEGELWPEITENINITIPLLLSKGLGDRLVIQCFDTFGLNYMHKYYPELVLSYLTDKGDPDYEQNKARLDFIPDWISPEYVCVTEEMVKKCHLDGTKIVPWTVDNPEDIQALIDMGCDAVITNYPDRALAITRGK